jgi:hypothetical protein
MPGVMGMQQIAGVQIAGVQILSVQVLSVQALRSQIASGGFRRGLDAGERKLERIHGGTCGRSERNWYA